MIWKGTHLSTLGRTADDAFQSKSQAMNIKEQSCVSRHRSGKGYKKKICCIECSQGHLGFNAAGYSIILKWNKLRTTRNIPRAGHPAKLSNRGSRAFQKNNHHYNTLLIWALWQSGQTEAFPQ